MIPVEQRRRAIFDDHGDNLQRGDCLTACVASIFELPYEDVPFFVELPSWHQVYGDFIRSLGFAVGHVNISVHDDDPTRLTGYPSDDIYWIATVKSPRSLQRCSNCKGADGGCEWCTDGRYPSLHAIVMRGKHIAWDPHPERDMGHLGFVQGDWFVALDPARLAVHS